MPLWSWGTQSFGEPVVAAEDYNKLGIFFSSIDFIPIFDTTLTS